MRFDADIEANRDAYTDAGFDEAGVGAADKHRRPWMMMGKES